MPKDYPCYDLVMADEPIEQGDFFDGCPTFMPDYSTNPIDHLAVEGQESDISGVWRTYDVVVFSQSCDLIDDSLEYVVVCAHWPMEEYGQMGLKRDHLSLIQKGYMPAYHMLHACELPEKRRSVHIVDFRTVYSVPYDYLKQFAVGHGQRVRLNSPYKEHLSQAFARFFMRVGLPQNVVLTKPPKK